MSGNLVKFGGYSLADAEEEKKQLGATGGADFFKFAVGKNVVRFLPPPVGASTPFVTVYQHFVKAAGGSTSFPCPRIMSKGRQPCPLCAYIKLLKASANPKDRAMAEDLYAKRRVFANILDRHNPEKGVQIAGFGKMIHEALNDLRCDEDSGGDFTNPYDGFDIVVERKGTGRTDTSYSVRAARNATPLHEEEAIMADLIGNQPDLTRLAEVPPVEVIKEKLSELVPSFAGTAAQQPAVGPTAQDEAFGSDVTEEDDDVPF